MDSVSEEKKPQVDVRKVLSSIWQCKWLYVKVLSIVFVLSCVYILPIPRTYTCQVMLAPEVSGAEAGGSLSSLASSFGVNLGAAMSQDAIFPALYPDLMASTDFILSLFPVPVVTEDGEVATNYCDYMRLHQKSSIWSYPLIWLGKLIALLTEDGEKQAFSGTDKLDAFRLTKEQQDVVGAISGNINCSVDKKTDVITMTVTDQDP